MLKWLLIIGSCLFLSEGLFASLAIEPARQELRVSPGGVFVGTYTATSSFEVPAKVTMSCSDWFTLPDNKSIAIDKWLKVYPSSFTINPGEKKAVNYEVSIPTAAKGELVGMINFAPDTAEMGIKTMLSTALYATVAGTDKCEWDISKVNVFKDMAGQLQIEAFVKNTGNVHVRTKGTVRVISRKTKEVAFELNFPEGRPAYPGSEQQMIAYKDLTLKPGTYTAITTLRYGNMERQKKTDFDVKVNKDGESIIQ